VRRRDEGAVKARLATFDAADWPAEDPRAAHALWKEARRAWRDEHGWPGGDAGWEASGIDEAVQTPDEPFDWSKILRVGVSRA
jgi:hypothetical protein